ncbi:endo-1,4-beta-xylanase [Demequina lutea]|uniref:Beta-xylanase n=1 Tax=Demequina lutea TaxID=431489 RepID=A0A7Y9ZBR5_9MICO|nr:endo-1,4-beta-xylanase [Demequina lutea]NYI40436.1 GH35 family endo-1,4-beta-xylanase [Demequina lutea]
MNAAPKRAAHAVASQYAHRTTSTTVTVLDAAGVPLAGREVTVEQTRHAFGFGNTGFDFIGSANGETDADAESIFGGAKPSRATTLEPLWFGLYNTVTLPFYWRRFEPAEGHPNTDRLMATARYFAERGTTIKGHPLVWHTLAPQWLMDKSDADVEAAIRARIRRDVTAFAGVIDLWDAINEAVILPVFTAEENAVTRLALSKGQLEMVRMAFEEAHAANPSARLVLNDFDLSADYENLIERCLEAGIQIDAIGVQTHMHQGYRGEDAITSILDRFGRFGLPVQMTETTLVSGEIMPADIVDLNDYQVESWPSTPEGEERQAQEMVSHYRNVFAHPATESLTYWGFADEGSWLGAPSGLVRVDGTPKPSYVALQELIKGEWWMKPTTVVTDDAGCVVIDGIAGEYSVTANDKTTKVNASAPGKHEVTVTLA